MTSVTSVWDMWEYFLLFIHTYGIYHKNVMSYNAVYNNECKPILQGKEY